MVLQAGRVAAVYGTLPSAAAGTPGVRVSGVSVTVSDGNSQYVMMLELALGQLARIQVIILITIHI